MPASTASGRSAQRSARQAEVNLWNDATSPQRKACRGPTLTIEGDIGTEKGGGTRQQGNEHGLRAVRHTARCHSCPSCCAVLAGNTLGAISCHPGLQLVPAESTAPQPTGRVVPLGLPAAERHAAAAYGFPAPSSWLNGAYPCRARCSNCVYHEHSFAVLRARSWVRSASEQAAHPLPAPGHPCAQGPADAACHTGRR